MVLRNRYTGEVVKMGDLIKRVAELHNAGYTAGEIRNIMDLKDGIEINEADVVKITTNE